MYNLVPVSKEDMVFLVTTLSDFLEVRIAGARSGPASGALLVLALTLPLVLATGAAVSWTGEEAEQPIVVFEVGS
jgi:hypothetical protein